MDNHVQGGAGVVGLGVGVSFGMFFAIAIVMPFHFMQLMCQNRGIDIAVMQLSCQNTISGYQPVRACANYVTELVI